MSDFFDIISAYFFGTDAGACVDLLVQLNIGSFATSLCLKLLLSRVISLVILVSSCLIKLPTFYSIYKAGSMSGFAPGAVMGEVLLFSNAAFYGVRMGFDFGAYGETLIQLVQAVVMFGLYLFYKPPASVVGYVKPIAGYGVYLAVVFIFIPLDYVYFLPRLNWPMVIYTRGAQIYANYVNGHTGSQSPITILMQAGGSAIRIFTTLVMIGFDLNLLMGYSLGTGLNCTLLVQWFMYRENTEEFLEKGRKKTNKKKRKAQTDDAEKEDTPRRIGTRSKSRGRSKSKSKSKTPKKAATATSKAQTPIRSSSRVRKVKML